MKKYFYFCLLAMLLFVNSCGNDDKTDNPIDNPYKPTIDTIKVNIGVIYMNNISNQNTSELQSASNLILNDINSNLGNFNDTVKFEFMIYNEYLDSYGNNYQDAVNQLKQKNVQCIFSPNDIEIANQLALDNPDVLFINSSVINPAEFTFIENKLDFIPNRISEIRTFVNFMLENGIENLAIVRDESDWADVLYFNYRVRFSAAGGKNFSTYIINRSHFDKLWQIAGEIEVWIEEIPASERNKYAVLLLAQDDYVDFMYELNYFDYTKEVNWFTVHENTFRPELLSSQDVCQFSEITKMYYPELSYNSSKSQEASDFIHTISLHSESNNKIALFMHDALNIIAETSIENHFAKSNFKSLLTSIASNYNGLTGNLKFDEENQRDSYSYQYFSLKKENNNYSWKSVANIDYAN